LRVGRCAKYETKLVKDFWICKLSFRIWI